MGVAEDLTWLFLLCWKALRQSVMFVMDIWNNTYILPSKMLVTVNITVSVHPAGYNRQKEKRSIRCGSSVFIWWSIGDSNSWPQHCQCCALPTALMPRGFSGRGLISEIYNSTCFLVCKPLFENFFEFFYRLSQKGRFLLWRKGLRAAGKENEKNFSFFQFRGWHLGRDRI